MVAENEAVESEKERLDNNGRVNISTNDLPTEQKGYYIWNPTINKYNDKRNNWISMGCSNMIVGAHDLHNVAIIYDNINNAIVIFVGPTPLTNIITNKTIMTQSSIKQGFKVFVKK